jgi:hypothetical protein
LSCVLAAHCCSRWRCCSQGAAFALPDDKACAVARGAAGLGLPEACLRAALRGWQLGGAVGCLPGCAASTPP